LGVILFPILLKKTPGIGWGVRVKAPFWEEKFKVGKLLLAFKIKKGLG